MSNEFVIELVNVEGDRLTYAEMPFTIPVPGREPWTEKQKAFEREIAVESTDQAGG